MIDKATVDRILDAADIVDVVSDFVSLKRRGSNWVGLCPFHHEKTPSFSVSRAKGLCHCFGCGKGGSAVNFIMEHEQLSYYEALKYLAKKYHIEVIEREMTDTERQKQSERESMLIINEAAAKIFESNLQDTAEGKDIGLSYFAERGFNQNTVKKFRLGYCLDSRSALYSAMIAKGYNRKLLLDTGLCVDDHHQGGFDRFKGRTIFPVINMAGKVVAFGGRTLKNEPAKYINSPESAIYKKSNELYGIYQAKSAIVKQGKCFLVEGYADVISMHQAGFENTVASSGTSLTEGQIRMIHRFTDNVTVLYDGDAAGIKASLRSIDLLLAEGLNIKVLLLPDGDDPDSFSRARSTSDIERYIEQNETDFIQFKTRILLEGSQNDPVKRASVITDIVKSIAAIPSAITRSVYAKECSHRLEIGEQVLLNEIEKILLQNRRKDAERRQRERENSKIEADSQPDPAAPPQQPAKADTPSGGDARILYPHEEAVARLIVKYGMAEFCDATDNEGRTSRISLLDFVANELSIDGINFSNSSFAAIYNEALSLRGEFQQALSSFRATVDEEAEAMRRQGIQEIRDTQSGIADIETREEKLNENIEAEKSRKITEFRANFLEKRLCSSPTDQVRTRSAELASEKHRLSKIHSRYSPVRTEYERLTKVVPEAICNWKSAILLCQIKQMQSQLPQLAAGAETEAQLKRIQDLYDLRAQLAKYIGERVVNPKL